VLVVVEGHRGRIDPGSRRDEAGQRRSGDGGSALVVERSPIA